MFRTQIPLKQVVSKSGASALFSLARDNLIRLKNEFSFQYQNDPRSDFTAWFNAHLSLQKDGTLRSSRKHFDGMWTPDGIFEHGMGMAVGPNVERTDEIKRRMARFTLLHTLSDLVLKLMALFMKNKRI